MRRFILAIFPALVTIIIITTLFFDKNFIKTLFAPFFLSNGLQKSVAKLAIYFALTAKKMRIIVNELPSKIV